VDGRLNSHLCQVSTNLTKQPRLYSHPVAVPSSYQSRIPISHSVVEQVAGRSKVQQMIRRMAYCAVSYISPTPTGCQPTRSHPPLSLSSCLHAHFRKRVVQRTMRSDTPAPRSVTSLGDTEVSTLCRHRRRLAFISILRIWNKSRELVDHNTGYRKIGHVQLEYPGDIRRCWSANACRYQCRYRCR